MLTSAWCAEHHQEKDSYNCKESAWNLLTGPGRGGWLEPSDSTAGSCHQLWHQGAVLEVRAQTLEVDAYE